MSSSPGKHTVGAVEAIMMEPTKPLTFQNQIIDERPGLGLPRRFRDVELVEISLVFVTWICAVLSLVAIFTVKVAAFLGQTHQLIVVGFLLSIMAYCMQGRSTKFLIAAEILLGESTLQNLEAILQMDCSSSGTSIHLRLIIVTLFALPLALSVAYKSFTGGTTTTTVPSTLMSFGMTPAPGNNNTGYGLSLSSTTLLPFWSSPKNKMAYGYSMWSESASTVAILDSPLEQDMYDFQKTLRSDESAIIEATVSAVQADMVMEWNNQTDLETFSKAELLDYFGYGPGNASRFETNLDLITDYFSNTTTTSDFLYSSCRTAALGYGPVNSSIVGARNNSFFATSRSNVRRSNNYGTFLDSAQGFVINLKRYRGTWNVTGSTAALVDAKMLADVPFLEPAGPSGTAYDFSDVTATVFQNTYYRFQTWISLLVEFDYKYPWARFDLVTCDPPSPETVQYVSNITTDTAFIATMVWSRVATKWGPTSAQYGHLSIEKYRKGDTKYAAEVSVQIHTQTLKRRISLAVVILVMPVLTTVVVVVQWIPLLGLRGSPVSNGFGLISLLAAVDSASLELLKGAGYSGKLARKVRAIFGTAENASVPIGRRTGLIESQPAAITMTLTPAHVGGARKGRAPSYVGDGIRLRSRAIYG